MYRLAYTVLLSFLCLLMSLSAGAAELSATVENDQVVVKIDDTVFTAYKFSHDQKYPYFWPVNGPMSGESVTTETTEPYPHHHSLFFGCDKVNGGNYWQESNRRGQILSQGPKIAKNGKDKIVIKDTCLWKQPKNDPIIKDTRVITITAPDEQVRFIDFEITLKALTDIRILKTNHSLFSARMVPELSVKSGGTLINAEGETGAKGTFGKASPWCDYTGTRNNVTEGLAIFQHPDNRWYPAKWFTRDYGFFSPTPMYWLENDRFEMDKGEKFSLTYRVVVHSGDVEEAGIADLFEQYKQNQD